MLKRSAAERKNHLGIVFFIGYCTYTQYCRQTTSRFDHNDADDLEGVLIVNNIMMLSTQVFLVLYLSTFD
jgi:uncharacterized protein (DUF983 family)